MRHLFAMATAGAALLACASGARAQPPGGPMPPEIQAGMKAWQKWQASHKNITALQQTMRGIHVLERDKATRLSKTQSRKLLDILHTWRPKKTLTDAQAASINKQITGMLTTAQRKALTRGPAGPGGPMPGGPPPGGMGGPPPGGPGSPPPEGVGGPPPSGFGPRPDRPAMNPGDFPRPKEYNPLNPDTLPFARMRAMERQLLDELTVALKKRVQ